MYVHIHVWYICILKFFKLNNEQWNSSMSFVNFSVHLGAHQTNEFVTNDKQKCHSSLFELKIPISIFVLIVLNPLFSFVIYVCIWRKVINNRWSNFSIGFVQSTDMCDVICMYMMSWDGSKVIVIGNSATILRYFMEHIMLKCVVWESLYN